MGGKFLYHYSTFVGHIVFTLREKLGRAILEYGVNLEDWKSNLGKASVFCYTCSQDDFRN